jgi:hypothetical protein
MYLTLQLSHFLVDDNKAAHLTSSVNTLAQLKCLLKAYSIGYSRTVLNYRQWTHLTSRPLLFLTSLLLRKNWPSQPTLPHFHPKTPCKPERRRAIVSDTEAKCMHLLYTFIQQTSLEKGVALRTDIRRAVVPWLQTNQTLTIDGALGACWVLCSAAVANAPE